MQGDSHQKNIIKSVKISYKSVHWIIFIKKHVIILCRYANIIIKNCAYLLSLPSRERGLKSYFSMKKLKAVGRSPRGSVD